MNGAFMENIISHKNRKQFGFNTCAFFIQSLSSSVSCSDVVLCYFVSLTTSLHLSRNTFELNTRPFDNRDSTLDHTTCNQLVKSLYY